MIAIAVLLCCLDLTPKAPPPLLDELKRVAHQAMAHPKVPWVKQFLAAADTLPAHPPRVFFHDAKKTVYYTEAELKALPEAERGRLVRQVVDDETFYGRIADPTGYTRPLEVLAHNGFTPDGARLLDFGYGNIGQLKMLAALGADAVGIEVDPLLPKLYANDQGKSGRGKVTTLNGYFPTDAKLVAAVGSGYRAFLSKNTLKHGYVHPDVKQAHVIELGGDEKFLKIVHTLLAPHGLFFIYNIGPAPAAKGAAYIPMADIRCPFSRAAIERAGFEVIAYDADDSAEMRAVGKLLEWDVGEKGERVDLDQSFFARYTLARKK